MLEPTRYRVVVLTSFRDTIHELTRNSRSTRMLCGFNQSSYSLRPHHPFNRSRLAGGTANMKLTNLSRFTDHSDRLPIYSSAGKDFDLWAGGFLVSRKPVDFVRPLPRPAAGQNSIHLLQRLQHLDCSKGIFSILESVMKRGAQI